MKKQFLFSLMALALLASTATAQQPAPIAIFGEPMPTSYIYFGNADADLDAEDKAAIAAFRKNLGGEIAIIQGFADNSGNADKNLALAQARAQNTRKYLLELGVSETKIQVISAEILAKSDGQNQRKVALQIKRDNSVNGHGNSIGNGSTGQLDPKKTTVEESPLASLNGFFAHCHKEALQVEQINPQQANFVKGKKGALIYIPANSLVGADGRPAKGLVSLNIQEAHSFGDMILQNWTTTAQGKILETGGMLRLEARDENGQNLQLAPGKSAQIALPNANAQAKDMQLFKGQIDPATNSIDWHATDSLVNNIGNNNLNNINSLASFGGYDKSTFGDSAFIRLNALAKACEIFTTPYARYAAAPNKKGPQEPKAPQLANLPDAPVAPNRKNTKLQNPQNADENNSDYALRIDGIYKAERKVYEKAKAHYDNIDQANRKKELAYKSEMKSYNLAHNKHQRETQKREAYLKELRYRLTLASDWAANADLKAITRQTRAIAYGLVSMDKESLTARVEYLKSNYQFFSNQHPAILTLMQERQSNIDAIKLSQDESLQIDGLQLQIYNIGQALDHHASIAQDLKRNRKMLTDAQKQKILADAQKLLQKEKWSEKDCHEADKIFRKIKTMPLFASIKREMSSIANLVNKNKTLLENADKQFSSALDEYNILNQTRMQLGLMTVEEIAQTYRNSMSINSLGNINCDRFYEDKSPKGCIDILVNTKQYNGSNTQFFIVFEDIQSVLHAKIDRNMFKADQLPLDRRVKIIGLYLDGRQAYIASASGTVRDFIKNKYQPDFQPKTLEETQNFLKNT